MPPEDVSADESPDVWLVSEEELSPELEDAPPAEPPEMPEEPSLPPDTPEFVSAAAAAAAEEEEEEGLPNIPPSADA